MAAFLSTAACKTKKKRKKEREKKLLCGEKVEVRQFEDGLKGSWSSGVVIRSERFTRHVEYTDLLSENGSSKLIELISVSPVVEGMIPYCRTPKTYRGRIRPLPPHSTVEPSRLSCGLCVDAFVNDAWWEGVVFDHEEGEGQRLIFFPDEGDQQKINVGELRLTQVWDEFSGGWRHRGDWLFLSIIKKIEQERSLPVSVRQIWYDVRANVCLRRPFKKKNNVCLKSGTLEWTCIEGCVWKKLVQEAVQENVHAAGGGAFSASDFVGKGNFAASKSRRKTCKAPILASGAGLGVQMDQCSLCVLDGCDFAEEDLAAQKSKRKKISVSQHSSSRVVSKLQVEEQSPQITDECIGLDNRICQPIFVSPLELNATAHEPAGDVRSDAAAYLLKDDNEEVVSAPMGCGPAAEDIISEEDVDAHASKRRNTCIVPSSTSTFVLRVQKEDYGFQQTLQSSDECVGQENQLRQQIFAFPSSPNAATLEIDVQNSSLKASDSHFDKHLSTCSHAILALPLNIDLCTPKPKYCSQTLPDSLSPYNDNDNDHPHPCLEPGNSLGSEYHMQPPASGRVLANGPSDLNHGHCVSPSVASLYSYAESGTTRKTDVIAHGMLNGNSSIEVVNRDDQGAELESNPACLEKEAHEALGRSGSWEPAGKELLSKAQYLPNSITEYCALVAIQKKNKFCALVPRRGMSDSENMLSHASLEAKLHLLFIGWKMERKQIGKRVRIRYISPEGKSFPSLHRACLYLKEQVVNGRQVLLSEVFNEHQDAEDVPTLGEENLVSVSSELNGTVVFQQEYCPQAVIDYYECELKRKRKQHVSYGDIKQFRSKARSHLSAEGWKFWYVTKRTGRSLLYHAPKGRNFYSLWTACKEWIENEGFDKRSATISTGGELVSKKSEGTSTSYKLKIRVNSATQCLQRSAWLFRGWPWSSGSSLSRDVGSSQERPTGVRKFRKRKNYTSFPVASQRLRHETSAHLLSQSPTAENVEPGGSSFLHDETVKYLQTVSSGSQKRKKRRSSAARITRGNKSHSKYLTHVLRSSKRAPRALAPCSSHHTVRTVLSWLIDNDIVLPRQKVRYMHRKDHRVMAEGRITREGIRCKCCKQVFSMTNFEIHAGSSNHRPSAHIFLQDGRSLLECQMQAARCGKLRGLRSDPDARMKSDRSRSKSDIICSICHYGGKLVLCDHCPSSFHLGCIDLKDVPEGKWSCPTCRCGICGKSDFNGDSEQFTEKTILYCDQCEREYHVGCLRKSGMAGLESCPNGNWFCSNRCSKIFMRLQKLVGKSKQTEVADLSWTLLKPKKDASCALDTLDAEATTEHHSKLSIALSVLHECFVPITEPWTKRDLVTDVIFNQGSELKRLNFRGFYTMLLERGDELISVATVRIHGTKVAEMPLIGTRVQYRQQGMCRLLMNELEKMLSNLGVERLLLPATPQMLPRWIVSFGFTQMTTPERLNFLEYTFLDFQDTTMCQKVLLPSTKKVAESRPRGMKYKVQDELSQSNEEMGYGKDSIVSEVIQTAAPILTSPSMNIQAHPLQEEIMGHSSLSSNDSSSPEVLMLEPKLHEQCKTVKQISTKVIAVEGSGNPGVNDIIPIINVAKQRNDPKFKIFGLCYNRKRKMDTIEKCVVEGSCAIKDCSHNNRFFKYYKRRRKLGGEISSNNAGA